MHTFPRRCAAAAVALAVTVVSLPSFAKKLPTDRPPDQGGYTRSMGIPSLLRKQVGFEFLGYNLEGDSELGGLVNFNFTRSIGHPVVGIAALAGEIYLGGRGYAADAGARAYFMVPSFLIGAGVDFNLEEEVADFILKLDIPTRRRGIVGGGSFLTLRWLPTRGQTFSIGISIPVGDRNAGKTRPQSDYVKMDSRKPERMGRDRLERIEADFDEAIATMRERTFWLARLTQPFHDVGGDDAAKAMAPTVAMLRAHMDSTNALFPNGHTLPEEIRVYHETLDRVFSIAESERTIAPGKSTSRGRRISAAARENLLDDVIFPYNFLFGQLKKKDTLSGMIAQAQTNFAKHILTKESLTDEQTRRCFLVFQTMCDLMEENREELRERWGDNRHVWLPLQYGLKPEEHDTQLELDRIIERATFEDFTHGNRLWYIMNEEFQFEMARSVRLAEDYHVLWIHDVAGYSHGHPDAVTYEQVRNYFEALIERVNAYDETGKLPMYMIMLDQHYFETNHGRIWMELLEAPLDYSFKLDKKFDDIETEINRLQDELRKAVDNSLMLKLEESQYGKKWLKNYVKVHVNITNPVDFSFYSMKIIGKMPVPDNNMRDHRKIAFYDITEEDPYRGMAMFTGMGLGEHYVGATWEDRAIMLQGPGALATKDAARFLLQTQGFDPEEMPYPLREIPKPATYEEKIDTELAAIPDYYADQIGVIQLHNETGFTPKPLNAAKCVLYSLMPPGSVLKVPDSLWQSFVYASLMAGSALRGCKSIVIAPSLKSAPSAGAPQMARANLLMKRIVVFGNEMDDYMEREGGIFRCGLYAPRQGVGDIADRFKQGMELKIPWSERVYKFHSSVDSVAAHAQDILDEIGYKPVYLTEKDSLDVPKLHLKANFFASGYAWDHLMARPEWGAITREYIKYLARQQGSYDAQDARDVTVAPAELQRIARSFLMDYYTTLTKEQRDQLVMYLTVGSCNMDYRSQVMNAEVMITLAGTKSLIGVMDFVMLAGLCKWPSTPEEVDALLPPPGSFMRGMSGLIKIAL